MRWSSKNRPLITRAFCYEERPRFKMHDLAELGGAPDERA